MRIRHFTIVLLSTLALVLHSCEDMISEVELDPTPPKLVVTSFISPDLPTITVHVYSSRPLYSTYPSNGEKPPAVTTAEVLISNGTNSVTLPYDSQTESYRISQSQLAIVRGETYYLSVSDQGTTVESECTVPLSTPPLLELAQIDSTEDFVSGNVYYHADLRFKDSIGPGQFYHVSASGFFYNHQSNRLEPYEVSFSKGERFVSDKNKDGSYFTYTTENFGKSESTRLLIALSIAVTDEHYYHYHKAVNNFDNENPFAEPTPIYSNIKGGLGVFAAYIQRVTLFEY